MVGEEDDVALSFPQWRQKDWKDIDSVIKVETETVFFDFFFEVFAGRGKDTDIDLDGFVRSQGFKFFELEDAKEFGLE